jgi:hypothetical protein
VYEKLLLFDVISGSYVFNSNLRFITGVSEHDIQRTEIYVRVCNEVKESELKIIRSDLKYPPRIFWKKKKHILQLNYLCYQHKK